MARSEHHPNGLIHYNPQLSYRGYTLFPADRTKAFLIDMEGRFVHQWQNERGISNPELLPNGNLMALMAPPTDDLGKRGMGGHSSGCYEMDWDGNVVWEYRDPMLHHDYQRLANGNTLLVKWARIPPSVVRRVKGGYHNPDDDPKEMLGDIVFEVTPQGDIVKEWRSWQHFDPKTEIICPLDHRLEWSHCNSIALSPKGDWLLSFRRINLVAEVSARTGKFKWKLANGIATHQHDVKYAGNNRITIFDNGVHRKGVEYSRAIEIDAKSKEIVWEYQDNPPFSFYTVMGGGVEVLPNGNVLICETAKGHFFEVTRDKKVVWEYINPFFVDNPRLGGRVNLVFRAHRYGPQHAAVMGRPLHPERLANLNHLYANG